MLLAPVFLPRLRDSPAAARPAGFFLAAAENNAARHFFCHTFQLIRASDYTARIAALASAVEQALLAGPSGTCAIPGALQYFLMAAES